MATLQNKRALHSRALYTARCVCTAIVPVHIHAACTPVECTHTAPPHFAYVPFFRLSDAGGGKNRTFTNELKYMIFWQNKLHLGPQ